MIKYKHSTQYRPSRLQSAVTTLAWSNGASLVGPFTAKPRQGADAAHSHPAKWGS